MVTKFRYIIVTVYLSTLVLFNANGATEGLSLENSVGAKPSSRQTDLLRQWQDLKFGMFIHYGLSTFTGDWRTNKNASPAAYAPSNLDVRQWIRTAKKTGMKYAVLTAKHTLGHCLWDSNDYAYDVAAGTDKTDVIDVFMCTCRAEGIKPGLYYCVLDIYNEGGSTLKWKAAVKPDYFKQIKKHLTELHTKYPDIFEQWIDIPHKLSPTQRWELYRLVKKLNPDCLVIMNAAFRDGVKIFEGAWPSDLANGEVTLPPESGHQPIKIVQGKQYYIPMEVCDTLTGNWFWHPEDKPRSPRHLYYLYSESIRRGANLLLNVSPDRTGRIPKDQVKALSQLRELIDNPAGYRHSVIKGAKVRASNVFQNNSQYSPDMAVDNKWNTRWATDAGLTSAWLEVILSEPKTFNTLFISEGWDRIRKFQVQCKRKDRWQTILEGTLVGSNYSRQFDPVTSGHFRLNITESTDGPTIWEFQLFD
jgi:alpha-L-fucosidase